MLLCSGPVDKAGFVRSLGLEKVINVLGLASEGQRVLDEQNGSQHYNSSLCISEECISIQLLRLTFGHFPAILPTEKSALITP